MTPDQLSAKIESVITDLSASFADQTVKTQAALFDQIQILLSKLDLNPNGTIIQSQANRAIIAKANIYFEKAFKDSGYYQALNDIPNQIDVITNSNVAYFSFVSSTFSPDAQYLGSLKRQVVDQLESMLANEGLEFAVKTPIVNILNQNINTGASYSDLLKQLRQFIIGEGQQGKLQSYSGQILTDALFNYSRALQEAISMKAGLEFVVYSGGLVADSRDFCVERAGQFFHKSEVEEWAGLDWQGKRAGTTASTIFIYAGGYRCNHQIIYVSEAIVPLDVIERVAAYS